MTTAEELRHAGAIQARLCRDAGSATYAAFITEAIEQIDSGHAVADLLLADGRSAMRSALFLRLLGAVHRLVLDDPGLPLASFYPTVGGTTDPAAAVPLLFELVDAEREVVEAEMQADVQTNEVGRSVALVAAMAWLSATDPLPLRLFEVGASAGLNLWLDRYCVRSGDRVWGPPDADVQLQGDFVGQRPPSARLEVVERRGCDRNPIDLTEPGARRILRSLVWPEHTDRLDRLDRAIAAFRPITIDRAPAGDWLDEVLGPPVAGTRTVVFHTIVTPYLSDDERHELTSIIGERGARATPDAPLCHVSLEPVGEQTGFPLSCTTWPGGRSTRLATCTPHGGAIAWDPTEAVSRR